MPPGLATPVRREWRLQVADLTDRGLPMPPAPVLVGFCTAVVRRREVAAALKDALVGTTEWRRLMITEMELSKQIGVFCAEFSTRTGAPAAPAAPPGGAPNPFARYR